MTVALLMLTGIMRIKVLWLPKLPKPTELKTHCFSNKKNSFLWKWIATQSLSKEAGTPVTPSVLHSFKLSSPTMKQISQQKVPLWEITSHPGRARIFVHTIRFFLSIICALTTSSMCVVNSFIFSRGMILNATKLFLFFQTKNKKTKKQPNTKQRKQFTAQQHKDA